MWSVDIRLSWNKGDVIIRWKVRAKKKTKRFV